MARRGAEIDRSTGRVVSGRMPRGSVENVTTIKEGPFRRLMDRMAK